VQQTNAGQIFTTKAAAVNITVVKNTSIEMNTSTVKYCSIHKNIHKNIQAVMDNNLTADSDSSL